MPTQIQQNFNPEAEMQKNGRAWIEQSIDNACIDFLENFGFYLCDKKDAGAFAPGSNAMTVSQLRNIFGEIKRIQAQIDAGVSPADWQNAFTMLRPKLAYSTARVVSLKRDNRIKAFRTVVELAHSYVNGDAERFRRFSQFVEGIIAYHKVHGGKD